MTNAKLYQAQKIPIVVCGVCGTAADYASQQPTPGMIGFCVFCGSAVFHIAGGTREITEAEYAALPAAVLQELAQVRTGFEAIRDRNIQFAASLAADGEPDDCDCSKCESRRKRAAARERAAARRNKTP